MSKQIKFVLLILLSGITNASAQYYVYTGGDEFESDILDMTVRWKLPEARTLYGNYELQYYTDNSNTATDNGKLIIMAKKNGSTFWERVYPFEPDNYELRSSDRKIFYGYNLRAFDYTSGWIESRQKYKYGYFEALVKIPWVQGTWPAFWMFGTGDVNRYEEIDIAEFKGERPHDIHWDIHQTKNPAGGWSYMGPNVDFSQSFHRIGLEWMHPRFFIWWVDGVPIAFYEKRIDYQKNIILNLAIASQASPFKPGPDQMSMFPATYEVEYMRCFYPMDCNKYEELADYVQIFNSPTVHTGGEIVFGTGNSDLANGVIKSSNIIGPFAYWPDGQYLQLIAADRIAINPNAGIFEGSHFSAKIIPCGYALRSSEGSGVPDSNELTEALPFELPDLGDSLRYPIFDSLPEDEEDSSSGGEGSLQKPGNRNSDLYRFQPNPSNGSFRVGLEPGAEAELSIYGLNGQLMYREKVQGLKDFNLESILANGLYLGHLIFNDSGGIQTFKIYIAK